MASVIKYFNNAALQSLITVLKGKFVRDANYVHTDNNYSATEKTRVADTATEVERTAPLYLDGALFVLGTNAFLGGSGVLLSSDTETLTASSTGSRKKIYTRLMKGLPPCLLYPACANASNTTVVTALPFVLKDSDNAPVNPLVYAEYRCPMPLVSQEARLSVLINLSSKSVTLTRSLSSREDKEAAQPFKWDYFSIESTGTVSPASGVITYTSSSTGGLKTLYDRVQKGWPPAISALMKNTDGTTVRVWAYPVQLSSGTIFYESCTLSNGKVSNVKLKINLTKDRVMCSLV